MQPSELKNLKIAVVGAGYGGAAAAKALSLPEQRYLHVRAARLRP